MGLFPSHHIRIGGDEAVKTQWRASEEIQQLIRERGLKDETELQVWFIGQINTFLTERGRRLVGWAEIPEGGPAPGAVVMSWPGEQGGIAAAQSGYDCPPNWRPRSGCARTGTAGPSWRSTRRSSFSPARPNGG
jgi:hexosaminidase